MTSFDLDARQVHPTSEGDTLVIDDHNGWHSSWVYVAWLVRDTVPIAMIKYFTAENPFYPGRAVLCDIEVREGYRGRKLSGTIIGAVQDVIGSQLWSSGSYTPKGYRSLNDTMPILPHNEPGVHFHDMTFVHNWDKLELQF